ncbi:restriction endonuclease subunit S [Nocardia cyriacigeorgica]|uniref:restriction endonuclease subunit S n=1 Tax=Nocardia cyriacigeorgica TaxID=135487 RepID=UPI0034DAEFED
MNSWRSVKLGDVAEEITVGHVGSMASEYMEGGIPFLRSQNIRPHMIELDDVKYISDDFHLKLKKSRLRPGDVVTVRTGAPGQTAVIPESLHQANCADLVITRPGAELDGRWVSYYLNWVTDTDIAGRLVGAVQQHFNVKSARELELLMPPLGEQRAIAEVLGALDDKIATNNRICNVSRALLAAMFERMEVDVDARESESIQLDEILEINPRERLPGSGSSDVVYLEMRNLPDYAMTVSSWGYRSARGGARFRNGDTLLARITPCLENGKVGYVDFLEDDSVGVGSTEFIVLRSRGSMPSVFPYLLCVSPRFRDYAIRHMVGTTGRQRLSASDVGVYNVRRPDPARLAEFGEVSAPLMDRVKAAVDETRQLAQTRDELLPLLMSGKLRVKDAEQIVEETA